MAAPISSSTVTTAQSGGVRGSNEKSSSLENQVTDKNAENGNDRASISEAAKSLNQPRETMNVDMNREQAQQLALEINALFSRDTGQALASQTANIDERVNELLQQTA